MNILYISYDGALDPLGYSQIVPYLRELSRKGAKLTLLTYEKGQRLKDKEAVRKLKTELSDKNIRWEIMKYHKSPSIPATIFDIMAGTIKGFAIVLRDKIQMIHARSFIGAIPALILAKALKLKLVFDMRGLWPDERIDGGIWKHKGLLYKAARRAERAFLSEADWNVCLTEEVKKIIEGGYCLRKRACIDVIPTCADTTRFIIRDKDSGLLKKFNLQDRFIFIYFGSMGTWYLPEKMIDFFKVAKRVKPGSFFMLLTPDTVSTIEAMAKNKVEPQDYLIRYIPYSELPCWISLADASVSFIKPAYSKKSSSPTKFAESLACGLPAVINSGIGDTEKFIRDYNIGAIVDEFREEEYLKAVNQLLKLLENKDNLRKNCRKVAEDFFSLKKGSEKYWSIYQRVLSPGN